MYTGEPLLPPSAVPSRASSNRTFIRTQDAWVGAKNTLWGKMSISGCGVLKPHLAIAGPTSSTENLSKGAGEKRRPLSSVTARTHARQLLFQTLPPTPPPRAQCDKPFALYAPAQANYLPDLVMIISVPSSWNLSQSSFVSRLQAILAISSLGMMGVVGISGSVHREDEEGLLPPLPNSA